MLYRVKIRDCGSPPDRLEAIADSKSRLCNVPRNVISLLQPPRVTGCIYPLELTHRPRGCKSSRFNFSSQASRAKSRP
jgi:hypothetical protein